MPTNWSGQYRSHPSVIVAPESVEQLQEIILERERYPSPVLAAGNAHSNSGCTQQPYGTALSLRKFRTIRLQGEDSIRVGAGCQLLDVHRHLAARGLQVPFTPEIGNATVGSAACCCLKDAALGQSTGFAVSMVRSVRFVDADGKDRHLERGDPDWHVFTSGHGLLGIIYEVTLDVHPARVVTVGLVHSHVDAPDWPETFARTIRENEGIFGFFDATSGRYMFETRNVGARPGTPSFLERQILGLNKWLFKYFNPIMGASESRIWSRGVRRGTLLVLRARGLFYPRGVRVYKNLMPIDYSDPYRFRWDFHFWAFPIERFTSDVLPAFRSFVADFKRRYPGFDEKGFLACYRVRRDDTTLLSPSHDGDAMTLDPVRAMSKDPEVMALWDSFLSEYNAFAVRHGGRCTFNQTKHVTRQQAEAAFGERWDRFREERRRWDPGRRFLSHYFAELLGEEPAPAPGPSRPEAGPTPPETG